MKRKTLLLGLLVLAIGLGSWCHAQVITNADTNGIIVEQAGSGTAFAVTYVPAGIAVYDETSDIPAIEVLARPNATPCSTVTAPSNVWTVTGVQGQQNAPSGPQAPNQFIAVWYANPVGNMVGMGHPVVLQGTTNYDNGGVTPHHVSPYTGNPVPYWGYGSAPLTFTKTDISISGAHTIVSISTDFVGQGLAQGDVIDMSNWLTSGNNIRCAITAAVTSHLVTCGNATLTPESAGRSITISSNIEYIYDPQTTINTQEVYATGNSIKMIGSSGWNNAGGTSYAAGPDCIDVLDKPSGPDSFGVFTWTGSVSTMYGLLFQFENAAYYGSTIPTIASPLTTNIVAVANPVTSSGTTISCPGFTSVPNGSMIFYIIYTQGGQAIGQITGQTNISVGIPLPVEEQWATGGLDAWYQTDLPGDASYLSKPFAILQILSAYAGSISAFTVKTTVANTHWCNGFAMAPKNRPY